MLQIRHDRGPASLLLTPAVLDHYLAEEVVAALHERAVPARLASEPGMRLICLEGSGDIVIQAPGARGS